MASINKEGDLGVVRRWRVHYQDGSEEDVEGSYETVAKDARTVRPDRGPVLFVSSVQGQ